MRLLTSLGLALTVLAAPVWAQDGAKPVKLMMVKESTPGFSRQFFGRVAARQTVDLAFQVAGQIVDMPVTRGTDHRKRRVDCPSRPGTVRIAA